MQANTHGQPIGDPVPAWTPRPRPGGVTLTGRHVLGEPIDPRHSPDLFAELCGPDDAPLWTFRMTEMPRSEAELDTEVVRFLAGRDDAATYVFSIAGVSSGLATFYPCVPDSGTVEISSVLWGRRMQRSAASTEAVHLMLEHVFDLGYRRVEWKCDSLNEPSRRAALRLGFSPEGTFRQHLVVKGRNRDTDWFSLLDHEWPQVRSRHQAWLAPDNFEDGRQRRRLEEC